MFKIFRGTVGHDSIHSVDVLSQKVGEFTLDDGNQPLSAYRSESTPQQVSNEQPWALGFVQAGWQAG